MGNGGRQERAPAACGSERAACAAACTSSETCRPPPRPPVRPPTCRSALPLLPILYRSSRSSRSSHVPLTFLPWPCCRLLPLPPPSQAEGRQDYEEPTEELVRFLDNADRAAADKAARLRALEGEANSARIAKEAAADAYQKVRAAGGGSGGGGIGQELGTGQGLGGLHATRYRVGSLGQWPALRTTGWEQQHFRRFLWAPRTTHACAVPGSRCQLIAANPIPQPLAPDTLVDES